ncbi:hypothetical protein TPHA_0N00450 [Tetrapisispora phaffii CBS 4417]|uniref:Alanine--tRNA ligase n=1 Tax=Tetrapisispora phaffii (strain ATCC 24235 / CBS 4417 / NBRC 1672 / NRRL Y-8282 / UCD 70-5) TaxID=1071381 RepID=G8C0Z7_TETPH|nr:hypothetical protein TPHA_0N00450 [Tetrapisispora phaffii CBS 4417]CCE65825.1 hypothetical protein TPHA_0N00450 [Tetrapisispora phaffii CBS 4417]
MSSQTELQHKWSAANVRETFFNYFKSLDHRYVASSSVIPFDDRSLLFTNAGMNQYKPIFLGNVDPHSKFYSLKSAYNSQKCIRAGGKHNDLEDVGKDSYHHTFFEMLGNWSFGDYFKKEAIAYSWTLLTKVYMIPVDRLYVTYFEGDPKLNLEPDLETRDLWLSVGVLESHIIPGATKDNFWEMGEQGPCGPCSEIHYDRIGGRNAAHLVNKDDPDVLEVWNLVFMQFNRESNGKLMALPSKHIDTGMGFERLVSILQNVRSNYDTDIFKPIFEKIREITKVREYNGKFGPNDENGIDTAYRVIADHARTLVVALADGGIPNNEGAGYVLRRIQRRGIRYVHKYMNYPIETFFSQLAPTIIEQFKDVFPEVAKNPEHIYAILNEEEKAFAKTLDRGEKLFTQYALKAQESSDRMLNGTDVWRLYDTFGFPLDLTQLMASELQLNIDRTGFEKAKLQSYEASKRRKDNKEADQMKLNIHDISKLNDENILKTDDSFKYGSSDISGNILRLFNGTSFVDKIEKADTVYGVILDKTCFYAEQGGQIYDTGSITLDNKNTSFTVQNVQVYNGYVLHSGILNEGSLEVGDKVTLSYNELRRNAIKANHTATHVLNYALRSVLGNEVEQRGSLVSAEKLRFDFSNRKALSLDNIMKIEEICNGIIQREDDVYFKNISLEKAKQINSIRTVPGEDYPDPVRVVSVGQAIETLTSDSDGLTLPNPVELCGGTHVSNTLFIGKLILTEETSIAKGIRRISAVTGEAAVTAERSAIEFRDTLEYISKIKSFTEKQQKLKEAGVLVNKLEIGIVSKHKLKDQWELMNKEVKHALKLEAKKHYEEAKSIVEDYFKNNESATYLVTHIAMQASMKIVSELLNLFNNRKVDRSLFIIMGDAEKVVYGCYISESAKTKGVSGEILINKCNDLLKGKGGGRGNLYQGQGNTIGQAQKAVSSLNEIFQEGLMSK